MAKGEKDINVTNNVAIKDYSGDQVGFQGINHVDVSASFSDTVDLPAVGYIYVSAGGTLTLMLKNSTVALPYTFPQAGIYPIIVKRIMSTGSDALTTYIIQ